MIINKDILLNQIYPVGSIYMSVNSTNPGTLFGGTWQAIESRFLIGTGTAKGGAGESYTFNVGATGGEYSHQLTVNEMPSHNHTIQRGTEGNSYFGMTGKEPNANPPYTVGTSSSGGNGFHNNLPPFYVVYMWKRTA